jgi:5-methylcytosine-specific restriction enzyme subunit McrC
MSNSVVHTRFSVYQNQIIKINQFIDGKEFLPSHLKNLQEYYGETGVPYYNLINKGVRFTSYVGVFQIGSTIFEVLPFLKDSLQSKEFWRSTLSYMLSKSGLFEFKNQFSSSQSRKNKSVLHQYFEIFLNELDILMHRGLIKNYNKMYFI